MLTQEMTEFHKRCIRRRAKIKTTILELLGYRKTDFTAVTGEMEDVCCHLHGWPKSRTGSNYEK